jgi:hypothetical protein
VYTPVRESEHNSKLVRFLLSALAVHLQARLVAAFIKWSSTLVSSAITANIRLSWKALQGAKTSLFRTYINYGRKKFHNIGTLGCKFLTMTNTLLAFLLQNQ